VQSINATHYFTATEVNYVSEKKKQEVLAQIHDALKEVPAEYRADVSKSITHDIGVMAKAISIANQGK
jgi:hypothetical protein